MEDEIDSRSLDRLEKAVSGLGMSMSSLKEELQSLSRRFDQLFEMLAGKVLLGKGEERPVELRDSSAAKSVFKSGSGSGGGSTSGGCRGDFGFSGVFGASRNAGSCFPTVSVSKTRSGEISGDGDGGSGGGGASTEGVFGLFSVVYAPRDGRSTFSAGSGPKSGSGGNFGGGGDGSSGGIDFSGGGGGPEGGDLGTGGRIFVPTWEKPSLNIVEEVNPERKADKLKRSPKTPMLAAVPTGLGIEPRVLLRPLLDIVGACLQIGMVESLGEEMQWRACIRKMQLSVLRVEDYEKGKATERDRTAEVSPMTVSYFPP